MLPQLGDDPSKEDVKTFTERTLASGKVVWQKNLAKDFGGASMSDWKFAESPLVDGDRDATLSFLATLFLHLQVCTGRRLSPTVSV